MKKFFYPDSIAVIGASIKPEKIGGIIVNNLLTGKYQGKIYPINPKYNQIKDLKCYHSVKEIKKNIDLAVVATPAETVPSVLAECATLSQPIKNFIIISAGFAEIGATGKILEQQIFDLAQKYDLKIIGPNCLGIINALNNLNASFAPNNFIPGTIGLISQSGAFATALLDLGKKENLGFSYIATIGNKTVIDETDILTYFSQDKKTKAIGIYLENIKRGNNFLKILQKASRTKPVFIIKGGTDQKTQSAILSHTGSMAGDEDVAMSLITDAGGFYLDTTIDLINNLKLFSRFQAPRNNKIAVLTNAGGPGILAADYIMNSKNLTLYEFSEPEKNILKNELPLASSLANPLDLRGDADHLRYELALRELSKIKNLGALLVVVTVQAQTDVSAIWQSLSAAQKYCPFPVIPVVMSTSPSPVEKNLPNFIDPSCAVNALDKYYLWNTNKTKVGLSFSSKNKINLARQKQSNSYLEQIKKHGRSILLFSEVSNLGKLYGFNILTATRTGSVNPEQIHYPVVLKIDSDKILHKNKEGGLILNIQNSDQLAKALQTLRAKFPQTDLIVQSQTAPGLEIIIGIKKDNNFGPVIMLGLGGIATEIFNAKMFFSPQSDLKYIKEKIDASSLGQVLAKEKIKSDLVAEEVFKAIELGRENPVLKEVDLNPLIFYPDKPPVIVDMKVILE